MLRFALAALGTLAAFVGARRLLTRDADLFGEVAIVTGGSRGLGFLLARELAREGCRLAICARDVDELERARVDLERRGAVIGALALVNRLLPRAGGTGERARGLELQRASGAGALHVATSLGRAAARRFHEYPPGRRAP